MNQKKLIQIIIITVLGVWVFCLSTIASVTIGRKMIAAETTAAPTAPPTVATTAEPTTEAPSTTRLPIGGNIVTSKVEVDDPEWLVEQKESEKVEAIISEVNKNNTTEKTTKKKSNVPQSKTDIIKTYVDAINNLKGMSDFSLYKDDKLNVTVDNLPNIPGAKSLADGLVNSNQKDPITYNFAGGTDAATGLTPNAVIAPLNVSAAVEESAVSSATAEAVDGGGYKITLLLIPETQTYTTPAKNHATMLEVVNVAPLIPDGITVNSLDMSYTDSKIEAVFDKDGKIISMVHFMKVEKAKVDLTAVAIPVNVEIHGDFTSNYTFSY